MKGEIVKRSPHRGWSSAWRKKLGRGVTETPIGSIRRRLMLTRKTSSSRRGERRHRLRPFPPGARWHSVRSSRCGLRRALRKTAVRDHRRDGGGVRRALIRSRDVHRSTERCAQFIDRASRPSWCSTASRTLKKGWREADSPTARGSSPQVWDRADDPHLRESPDRRAYRRCCRPRWPSWIVGSWPRPAKRGEGGRRPGRGVVTITLQRRPHSRGVDSPEYAKAKPEQIRFVADLSREHRRGLPRRIPQPSGQPDRPQEVLTVRQRFGIFGDGKGSGSGRDGARVPQGRLALRLLSRQTFMFASHRHAREFSPSSTRTRTSSRSLVGRPFDERALRVPPPQSRTAVGRIRSRNYNISADVSRQDRRCATRRPCVVVEALSRVDELRSMTQFSREGNEIAWGTIRQRELRRGDVLGVVNAGECWVPMLVSIWDDGYGFVPNEFRYEGNLSELLKDSSANRSRRRDTTSTPSKAGITPRCARRTSTHRSSCAASTSRPSFTSPRSRNRRPLHVGSQERYKSKERLKWENDFDCLVKMRQWMIARESHGRGARPVREGRREDGARSAAPRVGHIPSRDRH